MDERYDAYYVELARDAITRAENELRHAEQHMVSAGMSQHYLVTSITKLINTAINRNRELGNVIRFATFRKPTA